MGELLWAFGSMLIVMLIVYFLPLGLTKKGKVILVITSFLLALGGIAATSSFSFFFTVLILVVLILFVTYLLDQRLGKWLYSEDDPIIGNQENEDTIFMNTELETAASLEKVYRKKNEATIEPLTLLKDKKEKNSRTETKQEKDTDISLFETGDEDISFLLNRSISMEKETSEKLEEQKHDEVDYLAEIEELLNDDFDDLRSIEVSKFPQNIATVVDDDLEIPVISFEDKPLKKKSESSVGPAKKIEDFDEIPVLPFHEKEGEHS